MAHGGSTSSAPKSNFVAGFPVATSRMSSLVGVFYVSGGQQCRFDCGQASIGVSHLEKGCEATDVWENIGCGSIQVIFRYLGQLKPDQFCERVGNLNMI